MQKDDLLGSIGTVGASALVTLSYLWNIGALQIVFSFLAGSCATYVIQNRLQTQAEKRKIARDHEILMRDKVYGPLYETTSFALEKLEREIDLRFHGEGDVDPAVDIKEIMDKYLFLLSEKQLQELIHKLHVHILEYNKAFYKAEDAIYEVSYELFKKAFPQLSSFSPTQIMLYLNDNRTTVMTFLFRDAVLQKINPFLKFREKASGLEKPNVDIGLCGLKNEDKDLKVIEALMISTNENAWKEKRLKEFECKKTVVLSDLKLILPQLKKKVEL